MLKANDIIAVGYRPGVDVHLLCTPNGLQHIPEPLETERPVNNSYTSVRVALTEQNLVCLRLCGVSENDIAAMRKTLPAAETDNKGL